MTTGSPYSGSPMATAARNRLLQTQQAPTGATPPAPGTNSASYGASPGANYAGAGMARPDNAAGWGGGGAGNQQGRGNGGGGGQEGDGPNFENPDAEFNKKSYKAQQARLMRLGIRDYMRAGGPFWDSVTVLKNNANTNRFTDEGRAAFLAPRMSAITDNYNQASGQVAQNLADRGLADSSMQGLAQGALAGQAAAARAGATNDLYQSEDERQRMDQAQLRDLMAQMMGRSSSQASNLAQSGRQQELQRMMQEQQDGGMFGDILGSLGGLIPGIGGLMGSRRQPTRQYQAGDGGGGNYA